MEVFEFDTQPQTEYGKIEASTVFHSGIHCRIYPQQPPRNATDTQQFLVLNCATSIRLNAVTSANYKFRKHTLMVSCLPLAHVGIELLNPVFHFRLNLEFSLQSNTHKLPINYRLTTTKGPFIATQLNSAQLDVELSCVAINGP